MLCCFALSARTVEMPDWVRIDEAKLEPYSDQDAVVVLDERELVLKGGVRSGIRRRVVRVLDREGSTHATIVIARGAFDNFRKLKIWVQESNGKVERYGEDDGTLLSVSTMAVLDETEILVMEPPGASAGSTVAVQYEFTSQADIPQDYFRIQEAVPVVRAIVRLDARSGWQARARVASGRNPGPERVTDQAEWRFDNVPPVKELPFGLEPPRLTLVLDYMQSMEAFPFRDWRTTAGWAVDLFRAGAGEQPRVQTAVAELGQPEADSVERVTKMVRALRYFALEIGWGGYRPRLPETTLARGFGDCKDKSHLMATLLGRLGIQAFPILVSAPTDRYIESDLSGPRQFNHCVVGVSWEGKPAEPGMAIVDSPDLGPIRIIDPTLSDGSAQDIDVGLEGALGLPVDSRVGQLIRFPRSGAADNRYEQYSEWQIVGNGDLQAKQKRIFGGAVRTGLEGDAGEKLKPSELRRSIYASLSRESPDFESLKVSEIRVEDDGSWSFDNSFIQKDALHAFGKYRVFDLPPLHARSRRLTDTRELTEPPPLTSVLQQDHVELGDFDVITMPVAFDLETEWGRVSLSVSQTDRALVIDREVQIDTLAVDEESEGQTEQMSRAMRRINNVAIVLDRKDSS